MNTRTLVASATLASFGAISGLLLADLPETEAIPGLSPNPIETPSTESLPPALRDLLEGRTPASDAARVAVSETAPDAASPLEGGDIETSAPGRPVSAWERLQPEIDRRFAAMTDAERSANIAFVHFLARNGLEPDALTDEALAGAFDELDTLHAERDQELRAIQYADLGTGAPEMVVGEEIDDRSWEVMGRFRGLERDLGRRFGGTDQRPDPASTLASAASSR